MSREICTLQFGHYSNFVGTHWWNLQEFAFSFSPGEHNEIDNRILYREGLTLKGQPTYSPRLLLTDLNGSLNSLPEDGELYNAPIDPNEIEVPWDDNLVEVKENKKKPKNNFLQDLDSSSVNVQNQEYDFEKNVSVWSDYLYGRFHPKTVNIIKQYEHNSDCMNFDTFSQGKEVWHTQQFQDDFCDKIRNFIEECDHPQGFHVLLDASNGFSGLSVDCIEYLRDEYDRKSVLAVPLIPSYYEDYVYDDVGAEQRSQIKDSIRVINLALSFVDLAEHCSLFVPLCLSRDGWRKPGPKRDFNHITYNDKLMYHTSAILASALDTFSLKYRLKNTNYFLGDLCADLNLHNRKIAAASLCLPFSFNEGSYFIDCLDNWDGPLTQSITPNCTIGTDRAMQHLTLRGITEERLKKSPNRAETQRNLPAYHCSTVNEMLSFYMSCTTFGTATCITNVSKGLTLKKPYPNLFDSSIGVNGEVCGSPRNANESVRNTSILSGLHSCVEIGGMVESLNAEAKKLKIERFPQFTTKGFEKDDYKECLNKLLDLKECYDDNYLL